MSNREDEPYTPLTPLVFPTFDFPTPTPSSPTSPLSPDELPTWDPVDLPEKGGIPAYLEVFEKNINQFFSISSFKLDKMDERIGRMNHRLRNIPKGRTTYFELLSKYKSTVKEFQLLIRTMEGNKKRLLRDNEEQREKNKELRKIMALQTSGIQKNLSNEKRDYRLKKKKRRKRKNRIAEILQLQQQLQKRLHQHQQSQLRRSQKSSENSPNVEDEKKEKEKEEEEAEELQDETIDLDDSQVIPQPPTAVQVNQKIMKIQEQQQQIQQVPLLHFGSNAVWKDKSFQRLLREMVSWKTKSNQLKFENSKLQKSVERVIKDRDRIQNENVKLKILMFGKRKHLREMDLLKEELENFERNLSIKKKKRRPSSLQQKDDGGKLAREVSLLDENVVKYKRLSNDKFIKYQVVDKENVIETKKRIREREMDWTHIALRIKNFTLGLNIK